MGLMTCNTDTCKAPAEEGHHHCRWCLGAVVWPGAEAPCGSDVSACLMNPCDGCSDVVNRPSHYTQGGIECIDALEAATVNKRGIEAICTANAIKYLWRYESKGGAEDVRKARWYVERLLAALEGES